MNIQLKGVKIEEKEILGEMLLDYEEEITSKRVPYRFLDSYWEKENRFPFFIVIDKEIAGFVLVNEHLILNNEGKNICEFYIKKEYRGKNAGKMAAIKAFEYFPGKWEVREIRENPKARAFWLKVIDEYTKGNFNEIKTDDEKWNGWIQSFES